MENTLQVLIFVANLKIVKGPRHFLVDLHLTKPYTGFVRPQKHVTYIMSFIDEFMKYAFSLIRDL